MSSRPVEDPSAGTGQVAQEDAQDEEGEAEDNDEQRALLQKGDGKDKDGGDGKGRDSAGTEAT